MKCAFEGCNKEVHVAKVGLCSGHYQQYNSGKPLTVLQKREHLPRDEHGRTCTTCREYKPWSEFYRHSDGKNRRSACKVCVVAKEKVRTEAAKARV